MVILPGKEMRVFYKYFKLLFFCAIVTFIAEPASADSVVDQMKQEINELKKQVEELKEILYQQQQVREEQTHRVEKLEKKVDEKESTVISKFQFRPYGFIKLDAAYDDSRVNP